ncbi:hypothetical protein A0J61_09629 [Choanephora cucurbitarum]|uniref:Uncharacterized protein n=1 Tax=Choanephora cucurbitarum TaxID=101091 RepID=A0A1C7MZN2_9FUNG|nr:hypothetical protein A0J61_09629 [Choanephora cucurbitarum]
MPESYCSITLAVSIWTTVKLNIMCILSMTIIKRNYDPTSLIRKHIGFLGALVTLTHPNLTISFTSHNMNFT